MEILSSVWDGIVSWLSNGLIETTWWQVLAFTLVATHITIAAVTIFLHRSQAHRALELGPIPSHFFRFWLWLTTGMVTKEWVAIHRKHHARCEAVAGSPAIRVIFATGLHRAVTRAEKEDLLTSFITQRVSTFDHDAEAPGALVRLGETERGKTLFSSGLVGCVLLGSIPALTAIAYGLGLG